ncbi:unnamed protein product, partial [Symbiodinium sp. KB8]
MPAGLEESREGQRGSGEQWGRGSQERSPCRACPAELAGGHQGSAGAFCRGRGRRRRRRDRRRGRAAEAKGEGCGLPSSRRASFEQEGQRQQREVARGAGFEKAGSTRIGLRKQPFGPDAPRSDEHGVGQEGAKAKEARTGEHPRPGPPWFFRLRRCRGRPRRPAALRNEGCGHLAQASREHSPKAAEGHRAVRAGGHPRAWDCGGPELDAPRLAAKAAVGKVQGIAAHRLPRCCSVRDVEEWREPSCSSAGDSELEEQSPVRAGRGRLDHGPSADRIGGPPLEEGLRWVQAGDGCGVGLPEGLGRSQEAGQGELGPRPWRRRRRRRRRRGRSKVVHPALAFGNSKFVSYVVWFEGAQGLLPERSGDFSSLFPCALPYPEALLSERVVVDSSGALDWWSMAFVNTWVAWGNFVTLGCPSPGGSAYEPRVSYKSRAEARTFADQLLGEVRQFANLDLVLGRLGCSGKRGCIEEMLQQVHCTGAYCAGTAQAPGQASCALSVVPSRVALPEKAGMVDPLDWLEPARAGVVQDLVRLRRAEEDWDEIPLACHKVAPQDEDEMVLRLVAHGMAVPVQEAELPHDGRGRLLSGGLFGVGKNEQEDRLIYDRRPENATMDKLGWAHLPSGACYTRMLLDPCEYLRGSGDDLRNFYYTLKLPDNWVRYNSFGRRLSVKAARALGLCPRTPYRLCFRVLGMGDVNGCDIAQAVHEAVLRRHGLLSPASVLRYGEPAPTDATWEGVYIDDLLITQRCRLNSVVPLDGSFVPPPPDPQDMDVQRVKAAEIAYDEADLQRAVHKEFRFLTNFKAWGAEVDGILGKVGAPLHVRQQVWMLIFKIVSGGFCSKDVLRKVLGYLSYIFQYRRELYCLHHHIYKYVSEMPEGRWVKLPNYVADELRSCALHLPFAVWHMRTPLASTLVATDATPTSGGAVAVDIPRPLAQELWRQSEMKGEAVRLDRGAAEEVLCAEPKEPSVFASTVAECMPWTVTSSYSFRETSHVNLQELRALRREVIRLVARGVCLGTVLIALNDSRVVVGAVAKGRSSSFKLNGLLRGMLPHLVMGRVSLGVLWIETEANPADHPSRFRSLPPPRRVPGWLRRYGVPDRSRFLGLEVGGKEAYITGAHQAVALEMCSPVSAHALLDARAEWIDNEIEQGGLHWVWLVHYGLTAALKEILQILRLVLDAGGFFILMHPRGSPAWQLPGLRTAAFWLYNLVDRVLERCIDVAYQRGEKLYFVRVPMSKSILKALLVVLLATGKSFTGRAREGYWAAMLATWISFEGLLRPGETLWQTQFVLIKCPELIAWLLWWCEGVPRDRLLFRTYENLSTLQYLGAGGSEPGYCESLCLLVYLFGVFFAASREKPRARPSQSSQALVTGSQVAYREDIRTYVIIANPRQPDRVGCVQGGGSTTWRRLEETLPGGRLSGSAVRLRRVENWQHALQALLTAVDSAVAQMGQEEVDSGMTAQEILGDEQSLAWAASSYAGTGEAKAGSWQWHRSCSGFGGTALFFDWVLAFGVDLVSLTALLLGGLARLVLRGVAVLASSLVRELFHQASLLIGELEHSLITWLSDQLGSQGPSTAAVPLTTALPGSTSSHDRADRPPIQSSLPARPLDVITWVLLAYNAYL